MLSLTVSLSVSSLSVYIICTNLRSVKLATILTGPGGHRLDWNGVMINKHTSELYCTLQSVHYSTTNYNF